MENLDGVVSGRIQTIHAVSGSVSGVENVSGVVVIAGDVSPAYRGEYEITPSDSAVVLETGGLKMLDNIVINPIPSNYGRIAWNGSTLSVY